MPRGRKRNIIQSQDDYLSEDHDVSNGFQQVHQENAVASESDLCPEGEQCDSEADIDDNDQGDRSDKDGDIEENVEGIDDDGRKRGKTKLKHVWNIPKGQRIVVTCNDLDQPVGEEAGLLGKFLGMVARNGCLCSLSYKDWRLLIGKRERTTNEQKNKEDILKQVKKRFLYPARMEKWVLRTIGERWRQHKSNLKSVHFDSNKSKEANISNCPEGVITDQWIALVNNWMTPKAQDISEANRLSSAKRRAIHTAGPKSFARNREDLRMKGPEKKYPHRAVLYIHTHQSNMKKNTNTHVGELKELIAEHPDLADTSQGKVAWKGDALNRILGEDKPGHVHGMGLVPNPERVLQGTTSKRLKELNVTNLDNSSSEDVMSLRLQVEKLVNHVQKQDATIQDLQQKAKTWDRHPQQHEHGYFDDHESTRTEVHNTSIRKRVYIEPPRQEYTMSDTLDHTMREQIDGHELEEMQPSYINHCTKDKTTKVKNAREWSLLPTTKNISAHKETSSNTSKARNARKGSLLPTDKGVPAHKEASLNTSKARNAREGSLLPTGKGVPAHKAKPTEIHTDNRLNTTRSATASKETPLNISKQQPPMYEKGTPIYIKSWRNSKRIALGTVLSTDPNMTVGGVKLGKEFFMVRVGLVSVRDEPLIRPYKNLEAIGEVGDNPIAWPSNCVEKSFPAL